MSEKIKSTSNFIQKRINCYPEVGIVLGTGLGGFENFIEDRQSIPYQEIPGFPVSTVEGHMGRLITGRVEGKMILALQGRFHFYEGYSMQEITFPVKVLKFLGIHTLIVSNASGGLNPDFKIGDIMMINDHINMFGANPLIGPNEDDLGPRFPDMSQAYDLGLQYDALRIALRNNIMLKQGVYIGVSGPCFETPAEYKMFRMFGGDAIGMSTVPEVITARHMGIKVFGLSVITDSGVPGEIREITHEEVQEVAAKTEPVLSLLIKELIAVM